MCPELTSGFITHQLRQRLERMERRVQLQNAKQKPDSADENGPVGKNPEPSPLSLNSSSSSNHVDAKPPVVKVPANSITKISLVPEPPAVTSEPNVGAVPPPRKRIKTLLPVRTKPSPSPTSRRKNSIKSAALESDAATVPKPEGSNVLEDLTRKAANEGAITNVKIEIGTASVPDVKQVGGPLEGDGESSEVLSILPEHRLIQQQLAQKPAPREPSYLKKESILTMEEPYLTHVGESLSSQTEEVTNDAQVEVLNLASGFFFVLF